MSVQPANRVLAFSNGVMVNLRPYRNPLSWEWNWAFEVLTAGGDVLGSGVGYGSVADCEAGGIALAGRRVDRTGGDAGHA